MSLYQQLKAAGVPLSNHESDLYVKDTPEAVVILVANGKTPGAFGCERFRSRIDEAYWFDVPFMYDPYWEKRQAPSK